MKRRGNWSNGEYEESKGSSSLVGAPPPCTYFSIK